MFIYCITLKMETYSNLYHFLKGKKMWTSLI